MKKILSIDGGGIRGILPGQLLVALEKKIQKRTGNASAKIGDYFDLIAGTSTGGILATFLLSPDPENDCHARFSAQDAVDVYIKQGGEIFDKGFLSGVKALFNETYSVKNLEEILKKKLGEELLLSDLIKPCLITSYDIENRRGHFFNTLDTTDDSLNFFAWQVARATSAAPTYFEPARIKSLDNKEFSLIDGGVFANNPALCAYVEARQFFEGDNGKPVRAKDLFIVSLGTGSVKSPYMFDEAKDWGAVQWIKPLIDIMMSGSSTTIDIQLQHIFEAAEVEGQYTRIEPSLGGANSAMDDVTPKNLQALKVAGEDAANAADDQLEKIVDVLLQDIEVPVA